MNYTKKIVEARKAKKLSQTQVANALMISQQQYSRYENGDNELPIRYLIQICRLLEISADWVLGLSEKIKSTKNDLKKYEISNTITGEHAIIYFGGNITISDNIEERK